MDTQLSSLILGPRAKGMVVTVREVLRRFWYHKYYRGLAHCGRNVIFSGRGLIARPHELSIGNNVYISRNFFISARNMIIGNDVMIGPNLLAECDDHRYDLVGKTMIEVSGDRRISGIVIENDVWIGGNVTLLKGIRVSEGTVVGAGSVVTKSLPPYTICCGIPCRPLRSRFSEEQLRTHLQAIRSEMKADDIIENWFRSGTKISQNHTAKQSG